MNTADTLPPATPFPPTSPKMVVDASTLRGLLGKVGADRARCRHLAARSNGGIRQALRVSTGFQATSKDDFDNMARQFPAYDALYAHCKAKAGG